MTIRVLIADDQELVRVGLRMIIEAAPDLEIVAEATDGVEAVELAARHTPDVCLLDVRMPRLDGVAACRRIVEAGGHRVKVVVITTFDLDEHLFGALEAGATGFLLKDAPGELVADAVRAAAHGHAMISPRATQRLLRSFAPPSRTGGGPATVEISPREEEVLGAVAAGHTNGEIAESLHMSLSTVKSHVNSLLAKIGARNRVELAIWAHRSGRLP